MEDESIVALYWARNEDAIPQTAAKYGAYCHTVAYNILGDHSDSEECVNDTYLGAWNSMPPHRPGILSAFLAKICRGLSIDRWRQRGAQKRGGGQTDAAIEELRHCLPSGQDTEVAFSARELERLIDRFVMGLPRTERLVFLRRYWYLDPISTIARRFAWSESKTKSMLHRTRERLRRELEKEGYR